ncbi:alpha/beta hydrolase [Nocardioides sp. Kera G14]|uniref:alpha/beta hydrolase n=1 Tax=Nocardioides sp. Kera G14 TaxID=2884264 RepID=UPI001D127EAD|nr:alpha/beta hydrolase [Nocardioides sp. Kera G14]UDY23031.1 alpha/beta hydrolase [Nocardioides sp. Kera G14]
MTTTLLPDAAATSWNEPEGVAPRGTLLLLTGRGDTAASYTRFSRRLSADAYRVRLVEVDLDDLDGARAAVEALLADPELPSPRVLVGSDTGATLAGLLVHELQVDAAILAGVALRESGDDAPGDETWEGELEARSACPAYRKVISEDATFERGALTRDLPWKSVQLSVPTQPLLILHGRDDQVTPVGDALRPWVGAASVLQYVVEGGRHDILNDVTHRSVAATIVLFLERLKLGADLPVIVRGVGA